MYILINEDYELEQSSILTGKDRARARRGEISIINTNTMQGMNAMEMWVEGGHQKDFCENEWSDIPQKEIEK